MEKKVVKFLKEDVGIYPLFVNFKTYFERIYYNESHRNESHFENLKSKLYKIISFFLSMTFSLISNCIQKKGEDAKIDILFISRYRPKLNRNENRDYLFDSLIKLVEKEYNSAIISKSSLTEKYSHKESKNYNLIDALSFSIIFKSLLRSLDLYNNYKIINFKKLIIICITNLCLEEHFKTLKPKVVVVNEDAHDKVKPKSYEGKWMVIQSAHRSLKSHKFQKEWYSKFITEEEKIDTLCVDGPYFKKLYDEYFPHAKNIIITGQPRFDHLIEKKESKNEIKNLDPFNKTVVWATQTHGLAEEENKKNVIAMNELLENFSEINLLIKLHPGEDQNDTIYDDLENKHQNCLIINNEHELSDLSELLSLCDIFITKRSTTAIEASLMDKDILIVDYVEKSKNRYIQDGIAIGAYEPQQVKKKIRKLLNDDQLKEKLSKQRKKLNYEYNYLNDGKASERIAHIIEKGIESNTNYN